MRVVTLVAIVNEGRLADDGGARTISCHLQGVVGSPCQVLDLCSPCIYADEDANIVVDRKREHGLYETTVARS